MPAKIVEIPGVGNVEFPDSMSDEQIGAAIRSAATSAAKPQTWAQRLGFTDPRVTGMLDLAEGMAAGAASTVYHGGDLVRRLTGEERIIDRPEVQRAMTAPPSPMGTVGKVGEQIAEAVIPGTALTKGLKGAPLLTRIGAEAALGGGQAALQTGGDPFATGLGVVTGGAGAGLGGYLERRAAAAALTPADAAGLDYLAKRGAVVPAGVRTGSPYVRALEKISAYTPFGAMVARTASRRTEQALSRSAQQLLEQAHLTPVTAEEAGAGLQTAMQGRAGAVTEAEQAGKEWLAKQVHPVPVTAEQAGAGVGEALTTSAKQSKAAADTAYDVFRKAEADPWNVRSVQTGTRELKDGTVEAIMEDVAMPVDIRFVKKQLKPVYDRIRRSWSQTQKDASAALPTLKSIMDDADHIPATLAEENLGPLKELLREIDDGQSSSILKLTVKQLQKEIDDAAYQAGEGVLESLKAGRLARFHQGRTERVAEKVLGRGFNKAESVVEPVKAYGKLIMPGDQNINLLRRLAQETPGELTKIGRALVDDLWQKALDADSFGAARNTWRKLGPETKKLILGNKPELGRALDGMFEQAGEGAEAIGKLATTSPVGTASRLTFGNDQNIHLLRQVAKEAPEEMPRLGRATLENVFKKATEGGGFTLNRAAGMFADWRTLGDETKKILFKDPQLRAELDEFFLGIKKLAENPNPSGSALVAVAAGTPGLLLADPIGGSAYVLGMGALAKMLYSPGFARKLTQAMDTPLTQSARASGLFRHIMRSIPTQALTPAPKQGERPPLSSFDRSR
jgi:hypothetical protein